MPIPFVKMHGIGNDYVYVDAVTTPATESRFDGLTHAALIRRMSDRHRGIGSDGVILVCPPSRGVGGAGEGGSGSQRAHVRMRMFNSDGSESEMCGNGIRCVAKFAHDRLGVLDNPIRVQTGRGVLEVSYLLREDRLAEATVDMGPPILDPERVPLDTREARRAADPAWELLSDAGTITFVPVSMGNPHIVLFSHALDAVDMPRVGPMLERHPAFPNRTNVHLVVPESRKVARVVTWERGAGFTQACGTGACASLVAGVLTGRLDRDALLHLPGGDLRIRWDAPSGHVFMTGPAEDSFEGVWPE